VDTGFYVGVDAVVRGETGTPASAQRCASHHAQATNATDGSGRVGSSRLRSLCGGAEVRLPLKTHQPRFHERLNRHSLTRGLGFGSQR